LKPVIFFIFVFLCAFSAVQSSAGTCIVDFAFVRLDSNYNKYPTSERFFKLTETGKSAIIGKWKIVDILNKQPGWHVDITGSIYDFKSDQSLVVTPADSLFEAQTYKYHKDETRVTVITDDGNSFEYHYTLHEDGRLELDSSTENIILKPEN